MTDTAQFLPQPGFWSCRHTWRASAGNTFWCLLGCSIGDFGTILFFQLSGIAWPVLAIMILAIANGLLTSIALETLILFRKGMDLAASFKTAGGAILTWWVVPIMLAAGFVTPWPYNYWRLGKYGKACH